MIRRKSVCIKWTLVLIVNIFCSLVYCLPRDILAGKPDKGVLSAPTNISSTDVLRYRYKNTTISLDYKNLPSLFKILGIYINYLVHDSSSAFLKENNLLSNNYNLKYSNERMINEKIRNKKSLQKNSSSNLLLSQSLNENFNPKIKKIFTKWSDNPQDLNKIFQTNNSKINWLSNANKKYNIDDSLESDVGVFIKNANNRDEFVNFIPINYESKYSLNQKNKRYKPKPEFSEAIKVYSSDVQVVDKYSNKNTRPHFVYNLNNVKPDPEIINVGNSKPYSRPVIYVPASTKPPKRKKPSPIQYPYYQPNNDIGYPENNYEVSTFNPSATYTEKIIIRPQDYSAYPEDCPTVFLTLNNTFQGQGKEVCPDLNIAVNTNVINKNVVLESEEDEVDSFLPSLVDSTEDSSVNGFFDSDESENHKNTVDSEKLTNDESPSQELESFAPYTALQEPMQQQLSANKKPHIKNKIKKKAGFALGSFVKYLQPVFSTIGWMTTLSPLSLGIITLMLAPLAIYVTGATGLTALFAPLAFTYARTSPKMQMYEPKWHWDDDIKTWYYSHSHKTDWKNIPLQRQAQLASRDSNLDWLVKILKWIEKTAYNITKHKIKDSSHEHFKKRKLKS